MKVSNTKLAAALIEADGNMAAAARAVGLDRTTVWERVQRNPRLKAILTEAEDINLDLAKGNVTKALKDGCLVTSRWYLERKGRAEGFGNTLGLRLPDDAIEAFLSKLPEEALRELAEDA